MGYGSYSHEAHLALTARRRNARRSGPVFTQRRCHPLMDPRGVHLRESRDSEDHPESLAVIFALDVSGSMGHIPRRMATHTLPGFMAALLQARVRDPQILFMAVGCAEGDSAPLQVGQFESTESLIDQWLTLMYLEGGGGGGNESYELAMYFAARHTEVDCVTRRGRRGFLFLTGDEPPNPAVSRAQVAAILGDTLDDDIPTRSILEEAMRSWEPFFLIPPGPEALHIERPWRDLLGDRVVLMEHPDDTAYVAAGLVSLLEGSAGSLDELVGRAVDDGLERNQAARIARALAPFAASIGRDGAPVLGRSTTSLPDLVPTSGMRR